MRSYISRCTLLDSSPRITSKITVVFGGLLWREGSDRERRVGMQHDSRGVVARFDEEAVIGMRVLIGATSQLFNDSLWARRQLSGNVCWGGQYYGGLERRQLSGDVVYRSCCEITVFWWLALARKTAIGKRVWMARRVAAVCALEDEESAAVSWWLALA